MKYAHSQEKLHAILAKSILLFTVLTFFGFYYTSDPLPQETLSASGQDSLQQVDTIYRGFGNEPGWRLVVMHTKEQLQYDLLLEYGDIHLSGTAEELTSDDHPAIQWFILEHGQEQVWVSVTKESCIDESNTDHGSSIELSYQNREYLGCGSYQ